MMRHQMTKDQADKPSGVCALITKVGVVLADAIHVTSQDKGSRPLGGGNGNKTNKGESQIPQQPAI